MSTVVLTLVVVGGSIAVAAKLAVSGELKPATEGAVPHRAPRRRRRRQPGLTPTVEAVPPRPGLFTRLRAAVGLVLLVAVVGAGIALGILGGAAVISEALETAVQ